MKLFFRISVLALCISMSLSSFADDKKDRISPEQIDWSANNESLETIVSTSAEPNKIYLYATGHNKFVTVGGRYGAQPILAEVGMYFYVEKVAGDANRYYIHSWVHNPTTSQKKGLGDYLGVEPIMDTDQRIYSVPNDETKKSICLWIVERTMSMIMEIILLPIGLNGILSLLRVPLMVIKSILHGETFRRGYLTMM